MNGTWKLTIYATDDNSFTVDGCTYECDGLILVVNQGEDQFLFPMDFVAHVFAEEEEDETEQN